MTVVLYGTSNPALAQAEAPTDPPMVVLVGLDGADWTVVRHLWNAGELPHLRSVADRGVTADLATDFDARSPIIWTTMATGHGPEVHGIQDFVSDSAGAKSKPVESGNRTAKALWNITTEQGLDALVLGWWASWPVEEIRGFSLTDRSAYPNPRDNTWPRVPRDELFGWRDAADAELGELYTGPPPPSAQDRLVSWVARDKLSTGDFDLAMIYLRTVDLTSHRMWRYFEPETFQPVSAEDQAAGLEEFFDAYRAVDHSLGMILDALPSDANLLVVSDHGFHAVAETWRVRTNLSPVLAELGYWSGDAKSTDWTRSRAYIHRTADQRLKKNLRVNLQGREEQGTVAMGDKEAVLDALCADIAKVTYKGSGKPALQCIPSQDEQEADRLIEVLTGPWSSMELEYEGTVIDDAVISMYVSTGAHGREPPGLFLAAGPAFRTDVELEPSIYEIGPTLLQLLGLPYGEDMISSPLEELLTESFRSTYPARTIASWETTVPESSESQAEEFEHNAEMVEELRSLGYLE